MVLKKRLLSLIFLFSVLLAFKTYAACGATSCVNPVNFEEKTTCVPDGVERYYFSFDLDSKQKVDISISSQPEYALSLALGKESECSQLSGNWAKWGAWDGTLDAGKWVVMIEPSALVESLSDVESFTLTVDRSETGQPPQEETSTYCGDGNCDPDESCSSCSSDCGSCQVTEPTPYCGDGTCDSGESCSSCSSDCGSCQVTEPAEKKPNGGSCHADDQCLSDNCNYIKNNIEDSICTNKWAYGSCRTTSDCESADLMVCDDFTCVLRDGRGCRRDAGCLSGNCMNDVCCSAGKTCCARVGDCGAGYVCDYSLFYCVDEDTPSSTIVKSSPATKKSKGEKCYSNSECESNWCDYYGFEDLCRQGDCGNANEDGYFGYCCSQGEKCCSKDVFCGSIFGEDYECGSNYYCVKRTISETEKTTKEEKENRLQEKDKKIIGETCTSDSNCKSNNCDMTLNICCGEYGTCCKDDSSCSNGEECHKNVHTCVKKKEAVNENFLTKKMQRRNFAPLTNSDLGLEADFYVKTNYKASTAIVDEKVTAYLVITNKGSENIFVKGTINQLDSNVQNGKFDFSRWEPDDGLTLEKVPLIGWVLVTVPLKVNKLLWVAVQELWAADDRGFVLLHPNEGLTLSYEVELLQAGLEYPFSAELFYYSEPIYNPAERWQLNEESDTYSVTEKGLKSKIKSKKFSKKIKAIEENNWLWGWI